MKHKFLTQSFASEIPIWTILNVTVNDRQDVIHIR